MRLVEMKFGFAIILPFAITHRPNHHTKCSLANGFVIIIIWKIPISTVFYQLIMMQLLGQHAIKFNTLLVGAHLNVLLFA